MEGIDQQLRFFSSRELHFRATESAFQNFQQTMAFRDQLRTAKEVRSVAITAC